MTESTRLKPRWAKFMRFVMGLGHGRFLITVSIWPSGMDWSATSLGSVHVERDVQSD